MVLSDITCLSSMDKLRRPFKFTRRDTDSVQPDVVQSTTSGVEYGKESEVQAHASDSDRHSADAKAAEADLRKFSALHEWDPNLDC